METAEDRALAYARQLARLRKAGDDLYEAVMNSYQAGYLDEAEPAINAWHDLRIEESDQAILNDGVVTDD